MANPAFGAPKPKPVPEVPVVEPKAAAEPPAVPLPEPAVAQEIETEPAPKKPAKKPAPAPVTPAAAAPVEAVPTAAELLRASSTVNVIEPPKPKPAPKPSAASPMVETLATADYVDPMQAFADSIQVPLPTMRKRLLEFNADPANAGLPEDEWNRRAVDSLIRISPRYDQLAAKPPTPPPLPTYGFAQTDGHVLWSALRAEYEKEKYRGEKAKPPAQVFIEYAQARGMKPAELIEAAKAAGTDIFEIQRVAREDRTNAESLAEFNRLRLGGRYSTPEKARQARVAEAVTKPPEEKDRSTLAVSMSNERPFFIDSADEDPELTHTTAGLRYAQDVIDHIPPSRQAIFDTGFQEYAADNKRVFLDAANDVLAHGVSLEVKGIIGGKPDKKVIRLNASNAAHALQVMKDNGFDVSGPDAMKMAAAVGNEAKRRAVARAINEVAAEQINGHFASGIRTSIPFSQLTNLTPPGGYDPLSDDRDTMWLNTDTVDDARSMALRGDYLGAASQALAPTLTIAGFADIPGSTAVWPVLVREESRIETGFDWSDTPYALLRGGLEPVTEAWERGDRAEAAANLTLAGFGRVENGRIVVRSPEEIIAGMAAAVEHRENSFADLQESDLLTKYIETANYGMALARKMDFGLPDRYDLDYDNSGTVDPADRERGWTEYQEDVTFGLQNVAAFGGAVATFDMFDVLGALKAGRIVRALNRATEYNPAAVDLLDDAQKALVERRFEDARKAEEQLEFRPGHSREQQGPARARPQGQAPVLGQTSRVVDSVLAHEAHELGKADEMFDTAIEGALPDIEPVATSGPTSPSRRFYLHGSVRTSSAQYITTEDLRARYAFRHFYNILDSLDSAIADGRATYKTRLLRKFAKPIKKFVTESGLTGDAADGLRKLLRQNVAGGYSPMQIDEVLRSHLKGDAYDLANKAATELAAAVAKEEADAVKEGRIAVERARRAVDQQVASRVASMQRTVDFVRGPEPGTAFGKWLNEKLPFVRKWFSRFRDPESLVKVVSSEILQRAEPLILPSDPAKMSKAVDSADTLVVKRQQELEAVEVAGGDVAKAQKLLKAAMTRRRNAVDAFAQMLNRSSRVLSEPAVRLFFRARKNLAGQLTDTELIGGIALMDLNAEKAVEAGTAKSVDDYFDRFEIQKADTVPPDALLQDRPLAPAFYSGLRKSVEDLRQDRMSVEQFRAAVKKTPGVKQDEVDWTRLEKFLADKTTVTKADALDWLDENAVRVEVNTLGARDPAVTRRLNELDTEIERLEDLDAGTVDGSTEDTLALQPLYIERRRLIEQNPYRQPLYGEHTLAPADGGDLARYEATGEPVEGYREVLVYSPQAKGYASGHFGDKGENLLMHMRLSDRVTADGKRILFAEEFQSDWHQAGRKSGYGAVNANDAKDQFSEAVTRAHETYRQTMTEIEAEYFRDVAELRGKPNSPIPDGFFEDLNARNRQLNAASGAAINTREAALTAAQVAHDAASDVVSAAPFSKNWHEYLFKRLARMAAEEGYDGIGWTAGVQQVERYTDDFRQRVSAVDWYRAEDGAEVLTAKAIDHNDESVLTVDFGYNGNLTEPIRNGNAEAKTLADVFGREVANKILEDAKKAAQGTVAGDDLTVGGEGMKTFYDRMMPQYANDYARKNGWGSRVEMTDIGVGDPVHVMPLTEGAKEHVLYRGQTLFQRVKTVDVDGVQRPTTNSAGRPIHPTEEGTRNFWRWFGDSKVVDAEGRPLVVYHGTKAGGFDVFKPHTRKGEQLGFGTHFAVDEDFARLYAEDDSIARKGRAPQTYSVYLKSDSPLFADSIVVEGTPEFALAKSLAGSKLVTDADESGKRIAYLQHAIDATTPQRAERLLREAGYDSVRYGATVAAPGYRSYRKVAESQSWVVLDPAQVKSATGNVGTFDASDTSILRQDETPDFIEPERLSRGPRVVRSETGEMRPVGGVPASTYDEIRLLLTEAESKAMGVPGVPEKIAEMRSIVSGGRQAVDAKWYDLENLSLELTGLLRGEDARRMKREGKWQDRWRQVFESFRYHLSRASTAVEPLSVLPPQKVPTDTEGMTRVVRDTPWFHGAVRGEVQLREYDPSLHAGKSAGLMLGPGLYLAENPEVAIRYATASGGSVGTVPGKAALKTIMVSPERVLDVRPVAGETYAETLAIRLEAVGLTEDARIVRNSRINGPYDIGEKWLNRRVELRLTPDERRAADAIGLGSDRMTVQQIRSLLSRVADVTDESPFAMLEAVRDAYRRADATYPRMDEIFSQYPSINDMPDAVKAEMLRLTAEQEAIDTTIRKMDGIVDILGRRGIIVEDEIRDIHTNEVLDDEEIVARWRQTVEAKKVLEGALEKAKRASSPTQRLLEHFDGLFHRGEQDGNVLLLFDPNGKVGGRSIINIESRVLPERIVYQVDDLAAAKAFVQFTADGKIIVNLMAKADFSSLIHESAHIFRRFLDETDNKTVIRWTRAAGLEVELQNGLFVGPDAVKAEEMFARGFERFCREGKTPIKGLKQLFTNLRDMMTKVYAAIKGSAIDVPVTPEIEMLFNRMLSPASIAEEVKPNIHTGAADMSAARWIAGRTEGLLSAEDILRRLDAGEKVRLPFRIFGKDEIDINDLARLQVQIDTIAGSPVPRFKEPFKDARQQVVEPTLVGDIQSTLSQVPPEGSIEKLGFYLTKGAVSVVTGADAMAGERIFAPRFRELGQQGERLLNQRVGDMNVFLREQKIDDGRVPVIRYMTGQDQNFRVGGRTPLSAGHDAVAEVGEIIDEAVSELAQFKVQIDSAIDEAFDGRSGAARYVGRGGRVTDEASAAAPTGQMSQEVAVIARRVTELPTAEQRSNEVDAFFRDRPDRQRMVKAVVKALMTNGRTDTAAATVFRHLGMALLNNGVMEGRSVDDVIRTAQVPKMLAYVDAIYRLGGYEILDDVMIDSGRTSEQRLQDFIQVLDNAGFGPEGIDRALVVVNAFGAQKSIFAHVSDFGAAFTKDEFMAFNRFLNGDFKSAQGYANGLRMFKQFGFNHDALEEAAGLIEGSQSRYIPQNVQRRIGSALGRALDETTDQKNSHIPEAARWLLSFWQRQVVRGVLLPKAAKSWMDVMDTFFMTTAVAGVEAGARAASRQALQSLFIGVRGHLLGWLTRTIDQHGSATDRIRSGLQDFADRMVSPDGQKTVNSVLKGSDEIYRTADGRVYRYSDFLKAAVRHGTVSSFETSVLRESIRRSREATFIAGRAPTTEAEHLYNLAREHASRASHGIKNTVTDVLHANSELFEAWAERERVGVMMTFIEAGMNPDKAARTVVEALFDYPGSLATSELKGTVSGFLLTLAQPFWPFVKNANHFAINAIEKPEVLYRLTAMRRAVEYGQEAMAQTIYGFFVDPYGFDFREMTPESRASYYMLRDAYEKSLGKMPHEMTVEERMTLAAIILSARPDSPFAVADGKQFHLPAGVSKLTATDVSRLPGGNDMASQYRPEPRLDNVPPYMQRRIRTLFPARRTGAIESYIRATQQQDMMYAVAAFEPAPFAGMTYLANTLALYGYAGAVMTTEQSASAEQSLRAIRELADPERMPLVSDVAAMFQVKGPERVSNALAAVMQQHEALAGWVYPVYDEKDIPTTEYETSIGVDPEVAGSRKPTRWYTINPTLSVLLRTLLYDVNTTALNMQQPSGAFAREPDLEALRKVLYLVGPLKITEESQSKAAARAYYDLPPDARPR